MRIRFLCRWWNDSRGSGRSRDFKQSESSEDCSSRRPCNTHPTRRMKATIPMSQNPASISSRDIGPLPRKRLTTNRFREMLTLPHYAGNRVSPYCESFSKTSRYSCQLIRTIPQRNEAISILHHERGKLPIAGHVGLSEGGLKVGRYTLL